jgi:hypothetical protein
MASPIILDIQFKDQNLSAQIQKVTRLANELEAKRVELESAMQELCSTPIDFVCSSPSVSDQPAPDSSN